MAEYKYTPESFKSDQQVKWCAGCGDHAVLNAVQRALPEVADALDKPHEKFVFVSGIGCSSRFIYYMKTFGFHSVHGRANAILLPYIIEFNSGVTLIGRSQKEYPSCVRKYCNLARILGVSNMNEVTTIRALISYLHFLNAEMGIPAKVSEACPKLTEAEYMAALDDMAVAALTDGCTATNPRTPSKEEVMEIYKKIW